MTDYNIWVKLAHFSNEIVYQCIFILLNLLVIKSLRYCMLMKWSDYIEM